MARSCLSTDRRVRWARMLSSSLHWNTLHTAKYKKYTWYTQIHKIHTNTHAIQKPALEYTAHTVQNIHKIHCTHTVQHVPENIQARQSPAQNTYKRALHPEYMQCAVVHCAQCTQLTMFKLEKRAECRGERLRYRRHEMPAGKENSLFERGLIPSRCKISAQIYSTFLRASFSPPPNQTPITYKIIST